MHDLNYLPSMVSKNLNTKDKLISIISSHGPIKTRNIHMMLKKQYSTNISYQAVHKTLKQMVEDKILSFENNTYALSEKWVLGLKEYSQVLLRKLHRKRHDEYIDSDNAVNLAKSLKNMEIANFKFENLGKYDEFIRGFEKLFLTAFAEDGDELAYAQRHNRRPVMYPMMEQAKPNTGKNTSSFIVCEGDTVLDNWAAVFYDSNNMTVINNAKYNIEEDELSIFGQYVVRVYFSKELRKMLHGVFTKVKGLNDFHPDILFGKILEFSTDIMVTVQRNSFVARKIRSKLKKIYLSDDLQKLILQLKESKDIGITPTFDVEYLYLTRRQIDYYSNYVVPYLTEEEVKLIDAHINKHLPYEIFKKNHINLIDISANVGSKAQKIFTNFYQNYKINYIHITPTKKMKECSEEFFFRYPEKDMSFKFYSSKVKDLTGMDYFLERRDPHVFLLFDYLCGNYDLDLFISILRQIVIPDDLIVLTLQFTPEKMTDDTIKNLLYYYKHRYEGHKFDCGALYELGFQQEDLDSEFVFNKEKRQVESYSIIKNIPERLIKEVKEIGLMKGDKLLNYISRKPTLSMYEKKIKPFFSAKTYLEKENNVGVSFLRLNK